MRERQQQARRAHLVGEDIESCAKSRGLTPTARHMAIEHIQGEADRVAEQEHRRVYSIEIEANEQQQNSGVANEIRIIGKYLPVFPLVGRHSGAFSWSVLHHGAVTVQSHRRLFTRAKFVSHASQRSQNDASTLANDWPTCCGCNGTACLERQ